MPVKSMDFLSLLDDSNGDMVISAIDVNGLSPNSEPLLSDDIWKKFEFEFPELSGFDDVFDVLDATKPDSSLFPILDLDDVCDVKIRNHDCMWAGHCGSKEHPADEPRSHSNKLCILTPIPPVPLKPPAHVCPPQTNSKQQTTNQQQSVLKPRTNIHASSTLLPQMHTPQTPPMSDDEETKGKSTSVLQILKQAISECDLQEDSDLCDYFEDELTENVEEPKDVKPTIVTPRFAAENDHSYHKDKNASMRTGLGIDTPSDSEEEIDVVSVGEKQLTAGTKMVYSLPTNPSNSDRHQLQRRMATAIGKNNITNGIKTILPIRKVAAEHRTPVKRKMSESRGVRRSQPYKMAHSSPYKKRAVYHSGSESEPEPSEKRSLHNNMERQRRIDLRNAFEDLRLLVPEVSKKDRAAKVVILREAAQYCDHLGRVSMNQNRHLEELRRRQEFLRGRVSQLRRNLAANR